MDITIDKKKKNDPLLPQNVGTTLCVSVYMCA